MRKAFSLVELLIVVMCLAALACLAVPRMQLSLLSRYKSDATSHKITTDLLLARNLAITNAAVNNTGYALKMLGSAPYTGYSIVNAKDNSVVGTYSIDPNITCTGSAQFNFGPLGNLKSGGTQLTVSSSLRTSTITVQPSTGAVKCD